MFTLNLMHWWYNLFSLMSLGALGLLCGDCVLDPTEQCDDCNTSGGDGCGGSCRVESGYICTYNGTISKCLERCGDGLNILGSHECDDGNSASGDGCSSTCKIEDGYTCSGYGPGKCEEKCDGRWLGQLPCDERTGCCTDDCQIIPGC